jgi:hypothetical protein
VADFNGDGVSDLGVARAGDRGAALLGRGDGTFQEVRLPQLGPMATGDLDHNGRSDLVFSSYEELAVVLATGQFHFR